MTSQPSSVSEGVFVKEGENEDLKRAVRFSAPPCGFAELHDCMTTKGTVAQNCPWLEGPHLRFHTKAPPTFYAHLYLNKSVYLSIITPYSITCNIHIVRIYNNMCNIHTHGQVYIYAYTDSAFWGSV